MGIDPEKWIQMGVVGAPHGVRGWVKINAYTENPKNLLDYQPWSIRQHDKAAWEGVKIAEQRVSNGKVMVRFEGCEDRDLAQSYTGTAIAVQRKVLPPLAEGSHYWADLEGLDVEDMAGQSIGRIHHLFETGANDVAVIKGHDGKEYMVPYVKGQVIKSVDLDKNKIQVDWPFEDF